MKNVNLRFSFYKSCALMGLVIAACSPQQKQESSEEVLTIQLENTLSIARPDEPLVFTKEQMEQWAGKSTEGYPVFITTQGDTLPSQTDDVNSDGQWDEAALVYSFRPQEKVSLQLGFVKADQFPEFPARTNVRLGVSRNRDGNYADAQQEVRDPEHQPQSQPPLYQMEGPAWENDKVAFRSYFDKRNGKDIFGKQRPELVMDKVGIEGNYHELNDWGMDVLKVGGSLGSGALAMMDQEGQLVRLGETDAASFKVIAEGPARAIMTLNYEGWDVDGQKLNLTETITIWAGQYWTQSDVAIEGVEGEKTLVTGIVNKYSDEAISQTVADYSVLATHAQQSENKDILGMGLLVAKQFYTGEGETLKEGDGVTETYFTQLKIAEGKPATFYFVSAWERSNPVFAEKEGFVKLLQEYATRLSRPVKVTQAKATL
ncbi:DUF4861 domain-containing protein [Rapidithrix thailandica]|uniref:DUF4861 domain-containing protein n=1 Tax=Rapidithrix thailandica TaxID=413964 RepID=A0AAW9S1M3_9BACT